MKRDLFGHLPSEITVDILSRLSVRSIALSKCVCKPWLALLETDDFFNSHLSKSSADAALAVFLPEEDSNVCEVFELEDEVDDLESRNPITDFEFPREATFEASADSLLFLSISEVNCDADALCVCNPITREFIDIRFPRGPVQFSIFYGFAVSKVSRQHKVVRLDPEKDYCHVYTLGTGSWRRVEAPSRYSASVCGVSGGFSVNGNVYWLLTCSNLKSWISCFDLETECFSSLPSPPAGECQSNFALVTLRDGLCSAHTTDDEIMLWLLKDCGADKSWTMAYKIDLNPFGFECVKPIKVFKNGDILMLCDYSTFFCYSIETKAYREIYSFAAELEEAEIGCHCFIDSLVFTPSFRSLKRNFGMENVISY